MADFDHLAQSYSSMSSSPYSVNSSIARELHHFTTTPTPITPSNLTRFQSFCFHLRLSLSQNQISASQADAFVSLLRAHRNLFFIARRHFRDLFTAVNPMDVHRDLRNIWLAEKIGMQVRDFAKPKNENPYRVKELGMTSKEREQKREFMVEHCGVDLYGKSLPCQELQKAKALQAQREAMDPMTDEQIDEMLLEYENLAEANSTTECEKALCAGLY